MSLPQQKGFRSEPFSLIKSGISYLFVNQNFTFCRMINAIEEISTNLKSEKSISCMQFVHLAGSNETICRSVTFTIFDIGSNPI